MKRVIWIILDSVGMGALEDAKQFGDEGADTLGHIGEKYDLNALVNLRKLGLGHINGIKNIDSVKEPMGCFGKSRERSNGKDTTTGHWEMVGIYTKDAFPTYPNGFDDEIMKEFLEKTNLSGYLGNKVASGTAIIEELGQEHRKTGYPIIYTSADSVFQIAAHEEVIPLNRLYEICEVARKMLKGSHQVARVIARPFVGEKGSFVRTANRRDYSISPSSPNVLTILRDYGLLVAGVGKIEDIFNKVGITEAVHTKDNIDGVEQTLEFMKENREGLIFTNLVEFDSKWGHRRDVKGYYEGLVEFDKRLPAMIEAMGEEDILIINADHGCDPTFKGTDHTREYIPVLVYGKGLKKNVDLGVRDTFADIGQTILEYFNLPKGNLLGEGFLKEIR